MYRMINNVCPDYLEKTMSHILLTYHVEILDLQTVTNYIHHNLTANISASPSLPLHVKNATSVNTFKSLYLKWKRLNGH